MLGGLIETLEGVRRRAKLSRLYRSSRGGEILLKDREAGFFSIYMQALGALSVASQVGSSLKLDFTESSYFCPKRDAVSWWSYYFTTDTYLENRKTTTASVIVPQGKASAKFAHLGNAFSRHQAGRLAKQFVLRPEIKQQIEEYVSVNFLEGPIIGIHYRGTDKVDGAGSEASRVAYEDVVACIEHFPDDTRIFVATDEQRFLDFLKQFFGDRLLFLESRRSNDSVPVHLSAGNSSENEDGYVLGLEALLDAYILAETDLLFRTYSNLSKVSMYLSPDLPVFNLTNMGKGCDIGGKVYKNLLRKMTAYRKNKCI